MSYIAIYHMKIICTDSIMINMYNTLLYLFYVSCDMYAIYCCTYFFSYLLRILYFVGSDFVSCVMPSINSHNWFCVSFQVSSTLWYLSLSGVLCGSLHCLYLIVHVICCHTHILFPLYVYNMSHAMYAVHCCMFFCLTFYINYSLLQTVWCHVLYLQYCNALFNVLFSPKFCLS